MSSTLSVLFERFSSASALTLASTRPVPIPVVSAVRVTVTVELPLTSPMTQFTDPAPALHVPTEAAAEISAATGTPIVVATELANAGPDNPAPATLRSLGRLCHASAGRAVRSLHHLAGYSAWRRARGL